MKAYKIMNVVIITGSEIRHDFFYKFIDRDAEINVVRCFCEETMNDALDRQHGRQVNLSNIEKEHFEQRKKSEISFFGSEPLASSHRPNVQKLSRGEINESSIVDDIMRSSPDLIICYGCSLIKSSIISQFSKRIVNVHLGLSPYYRGAGTNIWPFINDELDLVGATFMHMDQGVDTGEVIHQLRANIHPGDDVHTICNRLIMDMTQTSVELIKKFDRMEKMPQINARGRYYRSDDFNSDACQELYRKLGTGSIDRYLMRPKSSLSPIISNPGMRL